MMNMTYTERDPLCWTKGQIGDDTAGYDFCIKHFDSGSQYGIDNGRISKLEMRERGIGKVVANYDRGWDVKVPENARAAFQQIIAEFN